MGQGSFVCGYKFLKVLKAGSSPESSILLAQNTRSTINKVVIKPFKIPEVIRKDKLKFFFILDKYLSLAHPGLSKNLELLFDKHDPLLVYAIGEFVDGQPLLPTITSLSTADFFEVLGQLLAVLHYLHCRNHIHLDLHANNILLLPPLDPNETWKLKLIDLPLFDISVLLAHRDLIAYNESYSAPEVLAGSHFDTRADLYSVGAILHHALVGDLPTRSSKVDHSLPGTLLKEFCPAPPNVTPEFLGPIIQKLLEDNPERRQTSSSLLLREINSNLRAQKLLLDNEESMRLIVRSTPLQMTQTLANGFHFIDAWITHDSESDQFLRIEGCDGIGKRRLQHSLDLYARMLGAVKSESESSQVQTSIILQSNRKGNSRGFPQRRLALDVALATTSSLNRMRGKNEATITCRPLDTEESVSLIDSVLAPNAIDTELKRLIATTGLGIPELILEQLLFLHGKSAIYRVGGLWCARNELSNVFSCPAPALTNQLNKLLHQLSEGQRNIILLLSLTPYGVTRSHLSIVMRLSKNELTKDLMDLSNTPLLIHSGDTYRLRGSVLFDVCKSAISADKRRDLAEQAHSFLASSDLVNNESLIPLLAYYAAEAGLTTEALRCFIKAAQIFESKLQATDALKMYQLALSFLNKNDTDTLATTLSRSLHLLDKVGDRESFFEYSYLLESVLLDPRTGDTSELLLELVHRYARFDEIDRAFLIVDKVLKMKNLSQETTAMAYQSLSYIYIRTGKARDATLAAKKALQFSALSKNPERMVAALKNLAGAYYLQGDYVKALLFLRHSVKVSRSHPDTRTENHPENNLGILYMESGSLRAASRALHSALRRARVSGDLLSTLESKANLCLFHSYCGNLKESADYYFQVIGPATSNGYRHVLYSTELSHAENLLRCGRLEASLQLIQKAKDGLRSFENEAILYTAELQESQAAYHVGHYELSLGILEKLNANLPNCRYRVQNSLCALGMISNLLMLGKLSDCKALLTECSSTIASQHMISCLQLRLLKAQFESLVGHNNEALRQLLLNAAIARRSGYRIILIESLVRAVMILLLNGQLNESETLLRRLGGLSTATRDRLSEPWIFQAMADHALALNRKVESKKYLLNARTSLLEIAYNISDLDLRRHFLNRADSRALLNRSEGLEDLAYEGFPEPKESPQATRALESIARINEQMHRRDSLKSTLTLILDEAIRLSEAERGIIFLFDSSGREELKVSQNIGRRSLSDARKYTRTALQRIRHGEIVFASDTITDPHLNASESITQLRIRSVICVPLRSRSSIIGALYLDSRRPRMAASPELLKSLEIFAQQAASALERAIRYFHLADENRQLRENALAGVPNLVGQGAYFASIKKLISAAANSDLPVLILGESGTGKELVARAIHYSGRRSTDPFLSVDCGALPENLVESELFGYRRGAFTGADRDKDGLFVAARAGSLFLDEIGNTTPALQAKLLRAIQEREIRPLGGASTISFEARLIAATNRDLRRDARDGRFRQDLLFRLNGITIEIPSLRERKSEIPNLIHHFLQKIRKRHPHSIDRISDEALQALCRYEWPGNIRELENCIERAIVLAREKTIHLKDLPDSVRSASVVGWFGKKGEHRLIEEALSRFAGDKSRAADYIGWNRQKLYRKMAQYNIPMDFGRRNTA